MSSVSDGETVALGVVEGRMDVIIDGVGDIIAEDVIALESVLEEKDGVGTREVVATMVVDGERVKLGVGVSTEGTMEVVLVSEGVLVKNGVVSGSKMSLVSVKTIVRLGVGASTELMVLVNAEVTSTEAVVVESMPVIEGVAPTKLVLEKSGVDSGNKISLVSEKIIVRLGVEAILTEEVVLVKSSVVSSSNISLVSVKTIVRLGVGAISIEEVVLVKRGVVSGSNIELVSVKTIVRLGMGVVPIEDTVGVGNTLVEVGSVKEVVLVKGGVVSGSKISLVSVKTMVMSGEGVGNRGGDEVGTELDKLSNGVEMEVGTALDLCELIVGDMMTTGTDDVIGGSKISLMLGASTELELRVGTDEEAIEDKDTSELIGMKVEVGGKMVSELMLVTDGAGGKMESVREMEVEKSEGVNILIDIESSEVGIGMSRDLD